MQVTHVRHLPTKLDTANMHTHTQATGITAFSHVTYVNSHLPFKGFEQFAQGDHSPCTVKLLDIYLTVQDTPPILVLGPRCHACNI